MKTQETFEYVVAGYDNDGNIVYHDVDHHSGGYPYATSRIESAIRFDVERASTTLSNVKSSPTMYRMKNPFIAKVTTKIEKVEISADELNEIRLNNIRKKLTPEELELIGL